MSRLLLTAVLALTALPVSACPTLDLGRTFEVEGSLGFSFQGPEGYEMRVSEIPDTLMSVQLRPEGASAMDIATGKVAAPTLQMSLALRPIPPENMEIFRNTDADKPSIELPDGTRAIREDIARLDIRHYLYPIIDGAPRELEVILMVPPSIEECVAGYEEPAQAIVKSMQF